MKKIFAVATVLLLSSMSFAGHFICRSHTQNFVIKQGSESMYVFYECNKDLRGCTVGQVFEALGFEEEGSFQLVGQRSNGLRSILQIDKDKKGSNWTASLSLIVKPGVQDTLTCESFKK